MRAPAATVALRRPLAQLSLPPRLRRRLVVGGAGLAVGLSAYLLVVRDLPIFAVERVSVTGMTTSDAPRLRRAITAAARRMTTLHVDHGRLKRTIAGYPAVARLEVDADFPKTLRIRVIEHDAAAVVQSGRSRVAVAADGTVLRGVPAGGALPAVKLRGALSGDRLRDGAALRAVRVAGVAPPVLRRRLESVSETRERGLVARLRRGPALIFGRATRLREKWLAAARVLADKGSRGASYVDLRLPDRPVAGGLPVETLQPVAPAGTPKQAPATTGATPAAPQPQAAQPPGQQAPGGAPPQSAPATPQAPSQQQVAPQASPAPPASAGGGAAWNPQP